MVEIKLLRPDYYDLLIAALTRAKRLADRRDWEGAGRVLRAIYLKIWKKQIDQSDQDAVPENGSQGAPSGSQPNAVTARKRTTKMTV